MFKRNLFQRVLPAILSMALIFQSTSATALAAENAQTQEIMETAEGTEPSGDLSVGETTEDPASLEVSPDQEDVPTDGDSSAEQETEEQETEDTETKGAETKGTETEDTVPLDDNGESGQTVTIRVDEETGIQSEKQIPGFTRILDAQDLTFTTKYMAGRCDGFVQALTDGGYIAVYIDGVYDGSLKGNLSYTWEKKEGASDYAPFDGIPAAAGEYRLKISVDAAAGSAETYIYIEIKKAELALSFGDALTVETGSTIQEFRERLAKEYRLETDGSLKDPAEFVAENGLTARVFKVKDGKRTELTDPAETFSNQDDYVMTAEVSPGAGAADNYTITTEESYRITVGGLRETKVVYTLADPGKEIAKPYEEGRKADLEWIAFQDGASGPHAVYTDKEGREIPVPGTAADTVTAAWYTRGQSVSAPEYPGEEIDGSMLSVPDGYRYRKLEEAPEDAGTYFVIYSYAGEEGKYGASYSAPVTVVIEPLQVVVTIDDKEDASRLFAEGMKAAEVKKQLSALSYKVSPVKEDGTPDDSRDLNETAFFGVSYWGGGATQTQGSTMSLYLNCSAALFP